MPETSLVVVDPGHFHATLVQQQMYPELSPVVRIYAPLGPDLIDYLRPAAKITGDDLPSAKAMGPTLGFLERPLGPARWGYYTTSDLYRAIREGKPDRLRRQHVVGACRRRLADTRRSRSWNSTPMPTCL